MTLTEFMAARLDEREALAARLQNLRALLDDPRRDMDQNVRDGAEYIWRETATDPARMLREVAAGRAILAEHRQWVFGGATGCSTCHAGHEIGDPAPGPCPTRRALGAVDSDHPDYDPAWAPGA